jgi:hypothetical protein
VVLYVFVRQKDSCNTRHKPISRGIIKGRIMLFLKFIFSLAFFTVLISPLHAQNWQEEMNFSVNVLKLMEG